jgi:2-oxoglutarate dehydrogenase E2 component (dihydrolipoamide succinyltransferase)
MTHFELVMPKMGESIIEATILRWTKNIGDFVEVDDTLVEIATDKVDTDVPSPVKGKLLKILFSENEVVPVGQTIAIIEMEMEEDDNKSNHSESLSHNNTLSSVESVKPVLNADKLKPTSSLGKSQRFYSPLVKNMAQQENITIEQLDAIPGTGMQGRLTKNDLIQYLSQRSDKTKPNS